MEKLIDLLNEYNEGGHWRDENFDTNKLLVISKGYGFIKWLVENDKIDLDKTGYKKADFQEVWNGDWQTVRGYEMLLMLLSIQDRPIAFLLNILK